MKSIRIAIVCLVTFISSYSIAQPGTLDSTFGVNGVVIKHRGPADGATTQVQTDGKIIVLSKNWYGNASYDLYRFLPNGLPDNSFGVNGVSKFSINLTPIGYDPLYNNNIKILQNGNYLAHLTRNYPSIDSSALICISNSGKIDSTFGSNGILVINSQNYSYGNHASVINSFELDNSGNIISASINNTNNSLILQRHLPNGLKDMSFGTNGQIVHSIVGISHSALAILILPNGKILLKNKDAFIQCTTNGALDPSFGVNGVYFLPLSSTDEPVAMHYKPSGKIVTGYANFFTQNNLNGTLDSSFGTNGVCTRPGDFSLGNWSGYQDFLIMPDERIAVSCKKGISLLTSIITKGGKLDSTFGISGSSALKVADTIGDIYYYCSSAFIQNNKLIVSACAWDVDTTHNKADTIQVIARYNLFPSSGDSVWPGDADHSGLADNTDLLPIGIAYGLTGPIRTNASIVWTGQYCSDWGLQLLNGTNVKHVDCNGDGSINANDTLAIVQNFGLTHAKNEDIPTAWRAGTPGLNIVLSKDTVRAGDTLVASIQLGDVSFPVSNIYGLAFTYNYDALVVDTSKTTISYPSSWLASTPERITISKDFKTTGQIKTAVTRINHINRSGFGEVAQVSMIITTDNINGKDLSYYLKRNFISSVTAIDSAGNPIDLNAGVDSSLVEFTPTGIKTIDNFQVVIYPNPASGKLCIKSDEAMLEHVALRNLLGESVVSEVVTGTNKTLDVSILTSGVYILQLETNKGELYKRVVISK